MKTCDLFKTKKLVLSAEVFPPKTSGNLEGVIRALKSIKSVGADYVSVTYGAGGFGSDTTADVASIAVDAFGIDTVAHMTAVNMTIDKLEELLKMLKRKGIENILALRGDIVSESKFYDFSHANDLAKYIKTNHPDFNLLGACYPEKHPDAESLDNDVENLKLKIEAGVSHLVTQLFYDNDCYYRFLDKLAAHGINAPISAGIMPMFTKKAIKRTLELSNASLPKQFADLADSDLNEEDFFKKGIELCNAQIIDLVNHGVKGIHLYTMNRTDVADKVLPIIRNEFGIAD